MDERIGFYDAAAMERGSGDEVLGEARWPMAGAVLAAIVLKMDGGGAAARANRLPRHEDFAFPQQSNPQLASPDWRPRFVDYLYLGFTNATAFSPPM